MTEPPRFLPMASMSPPLNFIAAIPIKKGVAAIIAGGSSPPHLERYLSWRLRVACRLKRRGAKHRDDSEAVGIVIPLPTATAAIHENPNPGVQMPAPFAQHPTLLVVDKGYSCTRATGRGLSFRSSRLPAPPPPRVDDLPWGRMSKLAEDRLARLLHEFANKRPFSIIGLRGEIDV
jgi:hypothetical protein